MDIASYGRRLPDYCENDLGKLQVLEAESEEYGQYLAQRGHFGERSGLLIVLMQHYFLWGDFRSAVRMGDEYSKLRDASDFVEYCIAEFLVETGVDATERSSGWLAQTSFAEAFGWDASQIMQHSSLGFDRIQDLAEFEVWASDSVGLEALMILAARLQKDETDEAVRIAIVETLKPFLTKGERLDRFYGLTNGIGSWPWDRWLNASLLLERYALQSEEIGLANQVRAARRYAAERMVGTKLELNWVDCVLDESGVFAPTRPELAETEAAAYREANDDR